MGNRHSPTGVVEVEFQVEAYSEKCIGIVIKPKPLTIVVPQHAAQAIEDDVALITRVDGVSFTEAEILPDAHLAGVHLTVLQLASPDKHEDWPSLAILPRRIQPVVPGDSLTIVTRIDAASTLERRTGQAIAINTDLDGSSIETDIPIRQGQSGSPILRQGRLYGVVQGQKYQPESGNAAVGIPLNLEALKQLRQLQQVTWKRVLLSALLIVCIAVLPLVLFLIMGSRGYPIDGVEVLDDRRTAVVHRNVVFPARSSWTYLAATQIFTIEAVVSSVHGQADLIAIGTTAQEEGNGALTLLNSSGKLLWTYSIPEEECIYRGSDETYHWFSATHIYPSDLDLDGENELIVAFSHMTWRPAKLMVFDLDGTILAEYWHPGYVRTITSGLIGEEDVPLTVVSASNNALQSSWWNPQVIFAFRGLDIRGRGPEPEFGNAEGSQLWYWVITNLDPDVVRAKATQLAIVDYDGDGINEIRASLTDGRFYYFNTDGEIVGTSAGDIYSRDYGNTPFPELRTVQDQLDYLDSLPQELVNLPSKGS